MGLSLFSRCDDPSHSRCKCASVRTERAYVEQGSGNPNPDHFEIKKIKQINRFVVMLVQFPDCFNYEGNKILVFEGIPINKLQILRSLDPHFCDSTTHPSPVARFEPTERGWSYALSFCKHTR